MTKVGVMPRIGEEDLHLLCGRERKNISAAALQRKCEKNRQGSKPLRFFGRRMNEVVHYEARFVANVPNDKARSSQLRRV
jgi:hypothetical protein